MYTYVFCSLERYVTGSLPNSCSDLLCMQHHTTTILRSVCLQQVESPKPNRKCCIMVTLTLFVCNRTGSNSDMLLLQQISDDNADDAVHTRSSITTKLLERRGLPMPRNDHDVPAPPRPGSAPRSIFVSKVTPHVSIPNHTIPP